MAEVQAVHPTEQFPVYAGVVEVVVFAVVLAKTLLLAVWLAVVFVTAVDVLVAGGGVTGVLVVVVVKSP